MSVTKVTGVQFAIGSQWGTQFTVSAITNANPAVATLSASHGIVVGDFFELVSGWDLANGRVFRVSAVATNDVTLEGFDSSSTTKYPVGTGTGTGREVAVWTPIDQISPNFTRSGGEQNFGDTTFVSSQIQTRIPTDRNSLSTTLPFFFDPTRAWVTNVRGASDAGTPYPYREIYPNASRMVVSAYWSLRGVPTPEDGTLRDVIDLSFVGQPSFYST